MIDAINHSHDTGRPPSGPGTGTLHAPRSGSCMQSNILYSNRIIVEDKATCHLRSKSPKQNNNILCWTRRGDLLVSLSLGQTPAEPVLLVSFSVDDLSAFPLRLSSYFLDWNHVWPSARRRSCPIKSHLHTSYIVHM